MVLVVLWWAVVVTLCTVVPAAAAEGPAPAEGPTPGPEPATVVERGDAFVEVRRALAEHRAASPPAQGASPDPGAEGPPPSDGAVVAALGAPCRSTSRSHTTPPRPGVVLRPVAFGSDHDCVGDRVAFWVQTDAPFSPAALGAWVTLVDTDGSGLFAGSRQGCRGAEHAAAVYQGPDGRPAGALYTFGGDCDTVVSSEPAAVEVTATRAEVVVPASGLRRRDAGGADVGRTGAFSWAGELTSMTEELSGQPGSVVPLEGWVDETVPPGGGLVPVDPVRVLDTRDGVGGVSGPVGAGQRRSFAALAPGVAADAAVAAVLHVTAVDPTAPTFLTLWPAGTAQPLASNLNPSVGALDNNLVVVATSADGLVSLYNHLGTAHVVADLFGYVTAGPDPAAGVLAGIEPVRVLDTRTEPPSLSARRPRGVDASAAGLPPGATAAVVNLTATGASSDTFVRAWAEGPAPWAVALNVDAGRTLANLAVVPLAPDGSFLVDHGYGTVDLVVDVVGHVAPTPPTGLSGVGAERVAVVSPRRVLDTRTGGPDATGPLAGEPRVLDLAGAGVVPAHADAVVLNVTAVDPTADGYLTVYPSASSRPATSTVNFRRGEDVPNLVVARLGPDGAVAIANHFGATHVVVDVAGWVA